LCSGTATPARLHSLEKGCQQQQTASLGGKDLQQKLKWDLHACPFEGAQETAEKDSKKSPKKKHSAVKVVFHSKKAPAKGPKGAH
jgi:hypothetical protein